MNGNDFSFDRVTGENRELSAISTSRADRYLTFDQPYFSIGMSRSNATTEDHTFEVHM